MKLRKLVLLAVALFISSGCASTNYRASPNYPTIAKQIKTIAVMPPDVKMFEISAGGISQEMDEWGEAAKKNIIEALKKNLADRYELNVKFIDEKWLKEKYKDAWRDNRSLYNAVSDSVYTHAFRGVGVFPYKVAAFEYTLGPEIDKLSSGLDADALLFIWGIDYELTGGRKAMEFFQAAIGGVYYFHPSVLTMGLVNAKTGDLDWIAISPTATEYNFRNQKHIESVVEWLTRSYLKKE
ncbi:MAG: hypothetical protein H6754_02085 [Candidatus Omnitrophica bacterium]|nr:hypothetical protein [Candidatus Omnitrophota bacterium]